MSIKKDDKRKAKIVMLDKDEFYGLGFKQVIQKFDNFSDCEINIFKDIEELKNASIDTIDISIVDSNFINQDSKAVLDWFNSKYKDSRILLLCNSEDDVMIERAIKLNVNGYLCRNCGVDELQFSLNQLINGYIYFSSTPLLRHLRGLSKRRINIKQEQFNLDELDIKIIQLIADEYTQLEMNQLLDLPTSTIMYLRRRLFIKMGVKNTAGMVKKAILSGIIQ